MRVRLKESSIGWELNLTRVASAAPLPPSARAHLATRSGFRDDLSTIPALKRSSNSVSPYVPIWAQEPKRRQFRDPARELHGNAVITFARASSGNRNRAVWRNAIRGELPMPRFRSYICCSEAESRT